MFMFKVAIVSPNWKRIENIAASSVDEATHKLHHIMWWDCYSSSEYQLSFIGKSKLS